MSTIILSIHPRYVKEIFKGTKHFELRKNFPKKIINKILIYETAPISKIVGEITVTQITMDKDTFFLEHQKVIGVTKKEYDTYYQTVKNDNISAYKIHEYIRYKKEISISQYGFKIGPQNFYYI